MFWVTVLDAFYQSLVCFFLPYFVSFIFLPKGTFSNHPSIHPSVRTEWNRMPLSKLCQLVWVGLRQTSPWSQQLLSNERRCCALFQALAGSDVDVLSLGSVINTSALLIILLHQVLESHTLVRLTAECFCFYGQWKKFLPM